MSLATLGRPFFWAALAYATLFLQLAWPQLPVAWWAILLVAVEARFGFLLTFSLWILLSWALAHFSSLPWLWWYVPVALMLLIKPVVTKRFLLRGFFKQLLGLIALSLSHVLALELWAFVYGSWGAFEPWALSQILFTTLLGMGLLILGPEFKAWLGRCLPKTKKPMHELSWIDARERRLSVTPSQRKPFGLEREI